MELMKLMESWGGYVPVSGRHTDAERAAFINLLSNADNVPAHLHEYRIREALTTSDFPLLFGDVLDRQMLAHYKATEPVYKAFTKMGTVPRISPQVGGYRFSMSGGDGVLAKVAEKGEYLASDRVEKRYALSVDKYGQQFDVSWEAMINDDLDALKDTPLRFATAAQRTESSVVAAIYANDAGGAVTHAVSGLLYSTVAAELNETAGALTIGFLEQGIEAMAAFTDVGLNPIHVRPKFLVVPPALEMTARQILTSTEKRYTGGAAGTSWPTTNVLPQYGLQLIVDPYLPAWATTKGTGASANTQWYLFADPREVAAMEAAHLRGHERPEICMKASDKVTIGGGPINPMAGDFATDNIFYRVRLVFGAARMDWRGCYMGGSIG